MIIGAVPYINALPLTKYLTGQVVSATPAELAHMLLDGRIDVGLIPLFAVIKHKLRMHPNAGIIGCDGAVGSVGFFTRSYIQDLAHVRSVYLDRESLSSAYLAKIVLKKFYGLSLYDLEFFHHDKREMADAQLLIGDKSLEFDRTLPHGFWDLGRLWKDHTGTGFMFACWASKRTLSPAELKFLKDAKSKGLVHLDRIVSAFDPLRRQKLLHYLTTNIVYQPTPNIKNGLKLYNRFLDEYQYSKPLKSKVA